MKDVLISERFDDIYFSKEDGVAETQHVFLQGNNLPKAWQGKSKFTIFETGFGTGLNFLSAWKLFEETVEVGAHLDFISVEKYPLKATVILEALKGWRDYFGRRINHFLDVYPIYMRGFHRIQVTDQVTLTLIFNDINEVLPHVQAQVDCWFLDGFTPAKNPEMWTQTLYENMARLSAGGTSYATFTAAGEVRRGLEAAGFSVQKTKGFGRKRDMIVGHFEGEQDTVVKPWYDGGREKKRIVIIGGGLAGTSCAYVLKQYGFEPVIYEAGENLGVGASGNEVGLYNPRFSKCFDPLAQFYASAYAGFVTLAKQVKGEIECDSRGVLYMLNDDKRIERYKAMIENWSWQEAHACILSADQASEVAGIDLLQGALYLPDAGSVNPRKLCEYYAKNIEVKYNTKVENLQDIDADAVILCCGAAVNQFDELSWLTLNKTRGQLSYVGATRISKNLKCAVNYGGYISVASNNKHIVGATFEKHIHHDDVTTESHDTNLSELKAQILPEEEFNIQGGRAAYRVASPDHFPVIGKVPKTNNIYVSTALGSYGLVSSLMGAKVITDLLRGGASCLSDDVLYALSPQRFVDRARKKGEFLHKSC